MKSKIYMFVLMLILVFIMFPQNSFSKKSSYSEAVTLDLGSLPNYLLLVTYEQKLSKKNSFTVLGGLYFRESWSAYTVGGSYRWYIDLFKTRKRPLEGFSVGPKALLGYWSWSDPNIKSMVDPGFSLSVGGEAVYKWVWNQFTLEAGANLLFTQAFIDYNLDISPFGLIVAGGYAW